MRYVYEKTDILDQRCYDVFKLTPDILMEHAGLALARAVKKRLTCKKKALFICGTGNNGADGMVAARLLHPTYDVALFCPHPPKSPLAKLQYERAKAVGLSVVDTLIDADVYVDALFGAGLNRSLDKPTCKLLETINAKEGYKIACDVPSGIQTDLQTGNSVFRADETVTMGALKLALLNDSAKDTVGKIKVADLGVSHLLYDTQSPYVLLQKKDLRLPFRRTKNSHKGTFGHVAIVQGIKEGAARLAGMGAFHFGAGLVTLVGEKTKKLPVYLMNDASLPKNADVIVAGMGLLEPFDENVLSSWLLENDLPLVIDASLSSHPLVQKIVASKKPVVFTPHPKEFSALLNLTCQKNASVEEIQANRFAYAKFFSETYPQTVLLLKGANTIIAHQGKLFINTYGEPSLAKGGSGDVLAGMIGALIAQGYPIKEAAIQASLAHALVSQKLTCHNFALTPIDICKGLKWL
jgi:hydroxyethylthiazole kinase-like uncharacterized protein yjeF